MLCSNIISFPTSPTLEPSAYGVTIPVPRDQELLAGDVGAIVNLLHQTTPCFLSYGTEEQRRAVGSERLLDARGLATSLPPILSPMYDNSR